MTKLEQNSADEGKGPVTYASTFAEIKERVRAAQHAALRSVNKHLVGLYWDIGRIILERQNAEGWGKAVVENLAGDLQPAIGIILCKEKNRTIGVAVVLDPAPRDEAGFRNRRLRRAHSFGIRDGDDQPSVRAVPRVNAARTRSF